MENAYISNSHNLEFFDPSDDVCDLPENPSSVLKVTVS
jgi:hypothetical protein